MEKEIFLEILKIKDILIKKIKTFEDYNTNKEIILNKIEKIEKILKDIFNIKQDINIEENIEPKDNNINNEQQQNFEENEENLIIKDENLNDDEIKEKENENEIIKEKNIIEKNKKDNEINVKCNNDNEIINNSNKEINNIIENDNEPIKDNEIINENKINQKLNIQTQEDNEQYSIPKLNFDYDKNINEILDDINLEQKQSSIKPSEENVVFNYNNIIKDGPIKNKNNSINNNIIKNFSKKKDEHKRNEDSPIQYLIKNKKDHIKEINNNNNINNENDVDNINNINNIKISNLQKNGYSELFSFNQDLSNINNKSSFTVDDLSTKKNKNNLNRGEDEVININNNLMNINTNNTLQSDENIKKINTIHNTVSIPSVPEYENENNLKSSKALRVADIIMKINSNDILYDIIIQLYTKDIFNQLMSPDVEMSLINLIEQTIEKIAILENEEIQKLKNKEYPQEINNNNNNNDYKTNSEIYNINSKPNLNINNINNTNNYTSFNKLKIPKKNEDFNKQRTSFSFYDKSNTSCYSQLPPRIPHRRQMSKYKAEYLNSEILQNYPKTGKTILGYEKFKKDKNREFNFERSLRNENYMNDFRNKKIYNFNNSKADSVGKNQSYNSNNRSFSNKKVIFNNYTSPFGDYFDGSLQKGGQSKLKMDYKVNNNILFKNCRSPVKDYIDGINDIYI